MTDTGAGTPLTAEEEREVRQMYRRRPQVTVSPISLLIERLLATLDAARSRPATDPAGLDVALAHVRRAIEWHRLGTRPTGISAELMHAERILARLSVADGPGPEERPDLEAAARNLADFLFDGIGWIERGPSGMSYADADRLGQLGDALRAALPVEETGRS